MSKIPGGVPLVLAASLCAAVSGRCAEPRPAEPAVIDLKPATASARSYRGLSADAEGLVEIKPFANSAGRLTFRIERDSVRADTNGDGRVDDADAPAVKPQRTTIKVAAQCGVTAYEYPIEILYVRGRMLVAGSLAAMEGRWGDRVVSIGDVGMDGVFGGRGDMIAVSAPGKTDQDQRLPWAGALGLEGRLYAIAVDEPGKLRIDPYPGSVSEFRISMEPPPGDVVLQMIEESGAFSAVVRSIAAPVRAVPGAYRISGMFGGADGGAQMYLRGFPKPVALGTEPLELRIGPPLQVDFEAVRNGPVVAISKVRITGASGENWQPVARGNEEAPAAYLRAGGREQRLATMEYG